jgi:demethylmenaquinone methyltransferase/2-methoxy-6-polyprenyl-1,4-benzoquinol methylase
MIAAQKQTSLPGSRPQGTRDEREAAARVRDMFARIAPRYDFLNHLLSFSLDRVWRHRTAKRFIHILRRPDARILDLCCGTGDLTFSLERVRASANATIMGSDFVEGMLVRARAKARRGGHAAVFAAADAMRLPFPGASFDLITTAFGFRNLANYEAGLREFARVLKPGGEVGILEFTEPGSGLLAGIFHFYFQQILPRVGKAISGDTEAYAYLPGSITKFPSPSGLAALMEKAGFDEVRIASWNFGTVLLHSARRT